MSANDHGHGQSDVIQEEDYLPGRMILWVIFVTLGLCVVLSIWAYSYEQTGWKENRGASAELTTRLEARQVNPGRLDQTLFTQEDRFAKLVAKKRALLSSYGPADAGKKTVRIPIEQAMQIVLQKAEATPPAPEGTTP